MIKIADVWGFFSGRSTFLEELQANPEQVTHIVLDFLNEIRYFLPDRPSYNRIFDIANQYNIPVTILTPYLREMPPLMDFTDARYQNTKLIHWETYWFNRTYLAWKEHDAFNKSKNIDMYNVRNGEHLTDFKYPYITLNNVSKNHRCLMMDILAQYNLIDRGAVAWRDIRQNCDNIRHTFPPEMTDSMYDKYPYRFWKPKRMFLDQDLSKQFLQETMPIEFTQSFMQLVAESDDDFIFYSEKTTTPILLNKPFLIIGAKGYHTGLKTRGFELYDEIFDYSFDNEIDDYLRYKGAIKNVNRISSLSSSELTKLHKQIFEKTVYNKEHALKLINTIPEEVLNVVEMIKIENNEPYGGSLNMFL